MPPITRRQLVQGSAAAAAAATLSAHRPARLARRNPNDEIRVAVVGVRGRGGAHIAGLHQPGNVRIVALCDVDSRELDRRVKEFDSAHGRKLEVAKDVRTLLERDDIDVISIATPNHHHALQTIWACQAGKDVYCEKPVSHNVWEGGQVVRAARKYGRVVQAGTQARSSRAVSEAIAWVREGNLGAITLARGVCYKPRKSIGKVAGAVPIPPDVDYDLYCGPAPATPLMRQNLHYDWHWQFATGNGDLGNQGVHQMDLCRWAIGADRLPPRAISVGGRFGYVDDGDTPNTLLAFFDYEPAPILFEVRGMPHDAKSQEGDWGGRMDRYRGLSIGTIIHCEGGWLALGADYSRARAYDAEGNEVKVFKGTDDHFANFIAAVRSRRIDDLNADIREGHLSSALCHMGNDSYKLGRTCSVDEIREVLGDEEIGGEALDRSASHLGANGVDLAATPARLGVWVAMDPETERYTDDAAKPLLTRDYREPFVVPAEV